MTDEFNSHILLYPAPDVTGAWIAHCLDFDIVSRGISPESALVTLREAVAAAKADDAAKGFDSTERRTPSCAWRMPMPVRMARPRDWESAEGARTHAQSVFGELATVSVESEIDEEAAEQVLWVMIRTTCDVETARRLGQHLEDAWTSQLPTNVRIHTLFVHEKLVVDHIILSPEEQARFAAALLAPPKHSESLERAQAKFSEMFTSHGVVEDVTREQLLSEQAALVAKVLGGTVEAAHAALDRGEYAGTPFAVKMAELRFLLSAYEPMRNVMTVAGDTMQAIRAAGTEPLTALVDAFRNYYALVSGVVDGEVKPLAFDRYAAELAEIADADAKAPQALNSHAKDEKEGGS